MNSGIKIYLLVLVSFCSAKIATDFNGSIKHVPEEIIVQVPTDATEILQTFFVILNNFPHFTIERSVSIDNKVIFLINIHVDMGDIALSFLIRAIFEDVLDYASYNFYMDHLEGDFGGYDCNDTIPEESCISESTDFWGLSRISNIDRMFSSYYNYKYSDSNNGEGVLVYVVDTGIYGSNEEFENVNVRQGYCAFGVRQEGFADLNGHGTHVAGIIAGKTCGVAKKAEIISVKVLDANSDGTVFDVIEALYFIEDDYMEQFVIQGRRPKAVVNLSLGFVGDFLPMLSAITRGIAMGITYVVAAGNDAIDACRCTPAKSPDAITVGAIDDSDNLASFSNYGSCVDILAPGRKILSADISGPSSLTKRSGTSMATPYVTGVIARLLSNKPYSSVPSCIKEHIRETAIAGKVPLNNDGTPNLILYAGCNSCFGLRNCLLHPTEDLGWIEFMAYSPDDEEGLIGAAEILKFRFLKLYTFFLCFSCLGFYVF